MLVVFLLEGAECGFSMDDRDEGDEWMIQSWPSCIPVAQ